MAKDQAQIVKFVTKTAGYTPFPGEYVRCDSTTGNFIITLPTAVSNENRSIIVKKISSDGYVITINTTSSQTIDLTSPMTSLTLTSRGSAINVVSNGTSWDIISYGVLPPDIPTRMTVSSLKTTNYQMVASDYLVGIGTLSSIITITLPVSPVIGDSYIIKDINGSAGGTYYYIISGGANNIDGFTTSFTVTQAYQSYNIVFTGSSWSLI